MKDQPLSTILLENIAKDTTDPRVSAFTKVFAFTSYRKFIKIQLYNLNQI